MAPSYTNIMLGPVRILRAPVGTALPDETTVAWGGSWGGSWSELGYTKTPVAYAVNTEVENIFVEQSVSPLRNHVTERTATLEFTLAELTGGNFALATGSSVTTTPAGASQVGFEEVGIGTSPVLDEYAWGLEGTYTNALNVSFPVRFFFWRGTAVMNGELTFGKSDYPGIPVQITVLADLSKDAGEELGIMQRVLQAAA